jgi:plastocyanin
MFNTAAKVLFGLAAAALVMAVGYAFAVDDPGGFVLIAGGSVAFMLSGLGIMASGFSDSAPASPPGQEEPPVQMITRSQREVPRPSAWPLGVALAAGLFAVGLATGHGIGFLGVLVGLLVAGGWLGQSWREDPSYSRREGSRVASRLLDPVGLPLGAICLIAVIVFSVSRILLSVPKNASIIIAFLLSVALLVAFFALAARPGLRRATMVFISGSAVVAVVTAGSVSAANGYRTFEKHEAGPGPITVVAQNIQFNQKAITVVQGQVTTITFKNDDPTYHNIGVYSAPAGGTPFWNGEPIKGPKKINYSHMFDMAPGTYAFRCDFHPAMTGTLNVTAASSATPAP